MNRIKDKIESVYSLLEGINRDLQFELDCIAQDYSKDKEGLFEIGISNREIYFNVILHEGISRYVYQIDAYRVSTLQSLIRDCDINWIEDYDATYRDGQRVTEED